MADIDLDQLRLARLEQNGHGESKNVLFGGEKFVLPPELPWDFALALSEGDARGGFRVLLGDEDYERFMALRPSTEDISALIQHLDDVYGASGEASSVSPTSSSGTSES